MTFEEIIEKAQSMAGALARRRQDNTIAPEDAKKELLRSFALDGAIEVARQTGRLEEHVEIDVVEGQASYEVPQRLHAVQVVMLNDKRLDLVDGQDARSDGLRHEGTPTHAGFYQGDLWLNREPQEAGTLHLMYLSDSMVKEDEGGDLVLLDFVPSDLRQTLVYYVLGEWYTSIGEHNEAGVHINRFERRLRTQSSNPRRARSAKQKYRPFG